MKHIHVIKHNICVSITFLFFHCFTVLLSYFRCVTVILACVWSFIIHDNYNNYKNYISFQIAPFKVWQVWSAVSCFWSSLPDSYFIGKIFYKSNCVDYIFIIRRGFRVGAPATPLALLRLPMGKLALGSTFNTVGPRGPDHGDIWFLTRPWIH